MGFRVTFYLLAKGRAITGTVSANPKTVSVHMSQTVEIYKRVPEIVLTAPSIIL